VLFSLPLQGEGWGFSCRHSRASGNPCCSLFFLEVQSFVSPPASRLLFGMTPGILPFAAPPPASLFAPLLRRSAQKVTKKARHRTRCFATLRARQNPLCFSPAPGCSDSTSVYCFASAAIHRRAPAGIFRRGLRCSAPRTAPLIHASVHPCTTLTTAMASGNCRQLLLRQDAAQAGPPRRAAGGVFLWLPFFAQAKKVTRSPVGRVEALHCQRPTNDQNGCALARE
jgi:hypothetical protein